MDLCKVISNMWFYKKLNESYSYMRKLICASGYVSHLKL
jgi:hypothetical protein